MFTMRAIYSLILVFTITISLSSLSSAFISSSTGGASPIILVEAAFTTSPPSSISCRNRRRFTSSSSSITSTTSMLRSSSHLETSPLAPQPQPSSARLSILQKLSLKLGYGKSLRERTVHTYFYGVDTKNIPQIINCFSKDGAIIRDACALSSRDVSYEELGKKTVTPDFLGERCNEFLGAHPDCCVKFHYGPTCGRGRNNNWVYAHWYETGTFSGKSKGIEPDGSPLTVQGQTRFLVDDTLKIKEIVITRTFSRWEEQMQLKK